MAGLTRAEKRKELERGALRHYGRKYAGLILFGPAVAKAVGLALAVLGVYFVCWVMIPHWVLGTAALGIALVAAAALVGPKLSLGGVRRRMLNRANGRHVQAPQLGWAYATLMIVGVGMGWLALWSPFA